MSPRKHVNGASKQIDTTKNVEIADPLANEYNFRLNREDEDKNFGVYDSVPEEKIYSQPYDYYGMVDFDETDHLYDLYCAHSDKGADEYEPFSVQILEEIKDVGLESGKQGDDYETSLYDIQSTAAENLDFENNGLLWLPPNAEVEEDAKEPPVCYDDDDDENEDEDFTGDWGYPRSPNSLSPKDLHQKEKSNQEHTEVMKDVVGGHFRSLILQLLKVENLPIEEENGKESWLEIITSLSWEVAALLKPDTSKDGGMDPGACVKIKCLACGHRSDSMLFKGVVCKKNVAHRRMMSKIDKPKLLILGGAVEYQRVSNHLTSVDILLRQEMEQLKMVVAKIEAHQPNILLVENSVSRYAQEYLLEKNISLVLKIKRPLLERIARCSGAQIIPSVENLVSPKLGHCDLFYVEKCFEEHGSAGQGGKKLTKNLMFFRDCPKPLGYTILLKGANGDELKKVKHVVQYGVFAAYHLALETSFLADEGASLPSFPIKPPSVPLPDKPSHVQTTILPNSSVPSTEDHQGTNRSELQKSDNDPWSYVSSPNWSDTSPSPIKCQSSSTQYTKYPSSNDQSPVALLSPIQQFSDSDNNDQFPNYDLDHEYERDVNLTPSSKGDEVLLDGSVVPNLLYTSDNLEEHDYSRPSSYGPSNDSSLRVSRSISLEENDFIGNEGAQLLREGVLPSPSEQHSILVSLTTRCVWKGILCKMAHFLRIKYYGSCDKPLGRFLQNDLFDQKYHCHSCEQPSEAHIYCYTHQQRSLTISVTKLVELILPGEEEGKIWMWHRCLRCPRINGFPPSTPRVAMSDAAWGFSFGKFLELSFSNHPVACRASSCGHSIHRDCLRFYGSGRMVACFRYAPINVHSVYLPPTEIEFNYEKQEWIKKEGIEVKNKVSLFFNEVNKSLKQIIEEGQAGPQDSSTKLLELKRNGEELERTLAREKEEIEESLKRALNQELKVGEPVIDPLELNRLKRQLLFQSYVWDQRLIHLVNLHKNVSKEGSSKSVANSLRSVDVSKKNVTPASVAGSNGGSGLLDNKPGNKNNQGGANPVKKPKESVQETNPGLEQKHALCGEILLQTMNTTSLEVLESGGAIQRSLSVGQSPVASEIPDSLVATLVGENPPSMKENESVSPEKTIAKSPRSGKSATACSDHDKCTKERVEVEIPTSPRITFLSRNSDVENSTIWLAVPFLNFYQSLNKSSSWSRHKLDSVKGYDPVYIMSFKELGCQDGARLLLPVGVNDTTVAVYDDEPSSIITYSLLTPDYLNQISIDADATKKGSEIANCLEHLDLEIPLDSSAEALRSFVSADESMMSLSKLRNSLAHDPLFYAKPVHTRVSFSDDGPLGKVNYTVVSYFARRFEALKKICCPSGVDFARSLSRCKKWGAQGGKSNVFFAKTMDDRFILKEVTKTELESFFTFAQSYFKYLLESINTRSPTCLAKIVGVHQVIKQPKGGKETKMDILVMENILYGRKVSRLYDLKGSSRSRYNSDSSGENNVLLDQNLLEAMSTSPIFVGNNAKRLLDRAVWNDSSFLASVDVMDYSLLVGVDEEKHELVVGIIDFMRQYTWDKHLETWVKASGILGGPKNASPTVISPIQYKKRFRKAMSTYFIMAPDHWTPSLSAPNEPLFEICEDSCQS